MPRPPLILTLMFLAALCLGPIPAAANLRAPVILESPSTALSGAPGLTVLAEELSLACEKQGCRVRAVYHLRAASPGSWRLSFVLPQPGKVKVRSGGSQLRVASRPATWRDPRDQAKPASPPEIPRLYRTPKMHQAEFQLTLPAGDNRLEVSYRQAWGRAERKFEGYFSGWLTTRTLGYELWPLGQWHLAPGFKLRLSLRVADRQAEAVLLRAAPQAQRPLANLALLSRDDNGVFSLERTWGQRFPARLEVVLGGWEALATYGITPPVSEPQTGSDQE